MNGKVCWCWCWPSWTIREECACLNDRLIKLAHQRPLNQIHGPDRFCPPSFWGWNIAARMHATYCAKTRKISTFDPHSWAVFFVFPPLAFPFHHHSILSNSLPFSFLSFFAFPSYVAFVSLYVVLWSFPWFPYHSILNVEVFLGLCVNISFFLM